MSMKKKTRTGQEKLAIVLRGLRVKCRINELCNTDLWDGYKKSLNFGKQA